MIKLTATCMACGSTNLEAELGMGQGEGYLTISCRDCGTSETWSEQGYDIQIALDMSNGTVNPWQVTEGVLEEIRIQCEQFRNPARVYLDVDTLENIKTEIKRRKYGESLSGYVDGEMLTLGGLRVFPVTTNSRHVHVTE